MYVQHESVDTINCITLYWKTVHSAICFLSCHVHRIKNK